MHPGQIAEIGNERINVAKIQAYIDKFVNGEITTDDFYFFVLDMAEGLDDEAQMELFTKIANMPGSPICSRTEEEKAEDQIRNFEERRKTNVRYVIHGNFTPAADDIDLQTIERVVFIDHIGIGGYCFVLDRLFGRVYFDPITATSIDNLDFFDYSAEFKKEDLYRFIQVVEESSLRDWPENHRGRFDDLVIGGGRTWRLGIRFSDGTTLRRSGSSTFDNDVAQSPEQLTILTDFIKTLGVEIIERYHAEAAQYD